MLARAVLIIIGSSFPYRAYVVEKLLYYHLVGDSLLSPKLELAILSNVLARLSVIWTERCALASNQFPNFIM